MMSVLSSFLIHIRDLSSLFFFFFLKPFGRKAAPRDGTKGEIWDSQDYAENCQERVERNF